MKDEIKEIAQMDANVLKSLEDFMEAYKMIDVDQIYSNGTEYVPIFRVKQWLEYNNITNLQDRIKELETINEEHRKLNGELRNGYCELKVKCNNGECDCTHEEYEGMIQANIKGSLLLDDYKTRNEKAIEYINKSIDNHTDWYNYIHGDEDGEVHNLDILLEILQGSDE